MRPPSLSECVLQTSVRVSVAVSTAARQAITTARCSLLYFRRLAVSGRTVHGTVQCILGSWGSLSSPGSSIEVEARAPAASGCAIVAKNVTFLKYLFFSFSFFFPLHFWVVLSFSLDRRRLLSSAATATYHPSRSVPPPLFSPTSVSVRWRPRARG